MSVTAAKGAAPAGAGGGVPGKASAAVTCWAGAAEAGKAGAAAESKTGAGAALAKVGAPARRIKSSTVRSTLKNRNVVDMFHGMLGRTSNQVTPVIYNKYLAMRREATRFIRLLGILRASEPLAFFPPARDALAAYAASLEGQQAAEFGAPDLAPWLTPGPPTLAEAAPLDGFEAVPPAVAEDFNAAFAAAKASNVLKIAIVTCRNLGGHRGELQDPSRLTDRFLTRAAGGTLTPLPDLPQLNWRAVYTDDRLSAAHRSFLLLILHKLYIVGHAAYEAVSAPDLDPGEFAAVIMDSIGEVRRRIPRCEQAFQKIADSVSLLKENFGGYYKDYAESGNASIIMENFVIDVAKTSEATPAVTAQFRRIIAHYKKLSAESANDPKLRSLFAQIDKNFDAIGQGGDKADHFDGADAVDGGEGGEGAQEGGEAKERAPGHTAGSASASPGAGAAGAAGAADPGPAGRKTARNRRKKTKAKCRGGLCLPCARTMEGDSADEGTAGGDEVPRFAFLTTEALPGGAPAEVPPDGAPLETLADELDRKGEGSGAEADPEAQGGYEAEAAKADSMWGLI